MHAGEWHLAGPGGVVVVVPILQWECVACGEDRRSTLNQLVVVAVGCKQAGCALLLQLQQSKGGSFMHINDLRGEIVARNFEECDGLRMLSKSIVSHSSSNLMGSK